MMLGRRISRISAGVRPVYFSSKSREVDADAVDIYERSPPPNLEEMRNKSRLSVMHYRQYHNIIPQETPSLRYHFTVKYRQKMFGTYGSASGIDPEICWPTPDILAKIEEYERIAYPFTIEEMVETAKNKREADQNKIEERQKIIKQNMAKLNKWTKDLHEKRAKKEEAAMAVKAKKEKLIEEVRREFGFTLSTKDERFQNLLAEKEKAQKKAEKQAKKAAKDAAMILRIQKKNLEINKTETSD